MQRVQLDLVTDNQVRGIRLWLAVTWVIPLTIIPWLLKLTSDVHIPLRLLIASLIVGPLFGWLVGYRWGIGLGSVLIMNDTKKPGA